MKCTMPLITACAAAILAGCATTSVPDYDTLIAHRGESKDAPENTLPAYQMAVDRGFGFECDVYLSSDNRVFSFHDTNLKRTTGVDMPCRKASWEKTVSKIDAGKWKGDEWKGTRPALLEDLTPETLDALTDYSPDKPAGAYGKLVTSYQWYFAAAMSADDAENLAVGRTATLNFGRYYGADIYARVVSISAPSDGVVAVVFRCDTALADTLAMRCVPANVVFATYSGIRVPAQAVQYDRESGTHFVWCVTAMQLERKDVEVVYADSDIAVIAESTAADALRDGNTVVVSGQDLYEGKIME